MCGTAAQNKETVVVPDVLEFPGHIACDADSRSEIVVPILFDGEVCRSSQKDEPSSNVVTDRCHYRYRLHRARWIRRRG